ncbi:hypothetical protein OROMI_003973 [Orobanche minor]
MGCIFCFPTSLPFHVAAAFLLWPSDPDLSIVRLRIDCLHLHTRPKISLDVITDLKVRVFNKDFYSMNYDSLLFAIGYRGEALGNVGAVTFDTVSEDGGCWQAPGLLLRLAFEEFREEVQFTRPDIGEQLSLAQRTN